MINQETKEKNLMLYFKKLKQLGIETNCLEKNYGEKIFEASFSNTNDYGSAFEGSFLEIILKKLTPYAVKLNELLPEEMRVDKDTLVKVCFLHQIAKAIRFVKNDNQWEIEKRGMVYKYDTSLPSIRCGLHSLAMATNCGIQFTVEEMEAMTACDRDSTDEQARWYSSVMATIVRQANELTYLELKRNKQ